MYPYSGDSWIPIQEVEKIIYLKSVHVNNKQTVATNNYFLVTCKIREILKFFFIKKFTLTPGSIPIRIQILARLIRILKTLPTHLKEGVDHGGNVVLLAGVRLAVPQPSEEVTDRIHVAGPLQPRQPHKHV